MITTDTRTMDQIRADLAVDMLLTAQPGADPTRDDDGAGTLGAIRAKVQIVVPVLSLIGSSSEPATLVGTGPIDPDTARHLAAGTRSPWERILTHPITGTVLHTDTYQRTHRSTGTSEPEISTAGSPDAGSPRSAAKWTTPSTTPEADPPTRETSRICVNGIIR